MGTRAVLERVFPARTVRSVEPVDRGNRKWTSMVEFEEHPPVVVQTATDVDALRSEAAVTMAIGDATSVPVPRVLASGILENEAYIVTEWVRGDDLHERFTRLSRQRRCALTGAFGRYLGELHAATTFASFGDVRPGGDRWTGNEWPTDASMASLTAQGPVTSGGFLEGYGTDALARLPPDFDAQARRLRDRLAERATAGNSGPDGSGPEPVLFPWDLRPGNALLDGEEIAAVLDWEAPMAAPAAVAVAKVEYLVVDWYLDDSTPERAAFRTGYETARPYPEVDSLSRALAIADSAVDSTGAVTNPKYPAIGREPAVQFHRQALEATR